MASGLRTISLGALVGLLCLAGFGWHYLVPAETSKLNAPRQGFFSTVSDPAVGPRRGALLIGGGGALNPTIWETFIDLAGGPDAPIVIVPTASGDDVFTDDWPTIRTLKSMGATNLSILHTRDRGEADTAEFVKPLAKAKGVWLCGGRQLRLVASYFGTRTHRAMLELLERGGVIGGTSAGATIQGIFASFPGRSEQPYEPGFGLLRNVAIDQHLLVRRRENDLAHVVREHPHVLGIGIDEGTAVVVKNDCMDVIGDSKVAIYDANYRPDDDEPPYYFLSPGDRFDLRRRTELSHDQASR
jgi:cyanophycinase